ncbi:hypothetical protein SCHPADRAFT_940757 [Schizopora paradoxa]|uniref:F-box domain-containing protein n=1 Tax=Schizopora paradoxa TaxID=27342 RepID=A0A0H2RM10_9AGAM|nr:hypothetical protein SCHPADRAFT_940757 [Schizopora paradoxa]
MSIVSDSDASDLRDMLSSLGSSDWKIKSTLTAPPPSLKPSSRRIMPTKRGLPPGVRRLRTPSDLSGCHVLALRAILDEIEARGQSISELRALVSEIAPSQAVHLGYSDDNNRVQRMKRSINALEIASDLAHDISYILDEEIKSAKDQLSVLSLQHGIASLPDDILSDVLLYAVRPTYPSTDMLLFISKEKECIRAAIKLSHVCSRFRSLVLSRSHIWNTLSNQITNVDLIRHCTKHAKKAPLKLYLESLGYPLSNDRFETFTTVCLESAANWHQLVLQATDSELWTNEESMVRLQTMSNNVSLFSRLTNGYKFPFINSLELDFERISAKVDLRDEKFHPHLHWTLPSLTRFSFSGNIPLPFSNDIKHLSISYEYQPGRILDMYQLLMFFAFCSSLESVDLKLTEWTSTTPCETKTFPFVKSVSFSFSDCSVDFIRTFCRALYFPDARKMTLQLNFQPSDPPPRNRFKRERHTDYGALMSEILTQHHYSGLTGLDLDLSPKRIYETTSDDLIQALYSPPFFRLPSLGDLTLSASGGWNLISLLDVPEDVHIPALQSLTLLVRSGDWDRVSGWIVALFVRIKEQEKLYRFKTLRIKLIHDFTHETESEIKSNRDLFERNVRNCVSQADPRIRVEIISNQD